MVFHDGVAPSVGDGDEVKHGVLRRRPVGLLLSLCSELGKPRVSDVCTTGRGVERSRWCGSAGPYGSGNDRRTVVVSSSSGEIRFPLAHACGNRRRGKRLRGSSRRLARVRCPERSRGRTGAQIDSGSGAAACAMRHSGLRLGEEDEQARDPLVSGWGEVDRGRASDAGQVRAYRFGNDCE